MTWLLEVTEFIIMNTVEYVLQHNKVRTISNVRTVWIIAMGVFNCVLYIPFVQVNAVNNDTQSRVAARTFDQPLAIFFENLI